MAIPTKALTAKVNNNLAEGQTIQRFFLLRHFEKQTDDKVKNLDPPLTAEGNRYAEKLAQVLSPANISIVFSSPYLRTQQSVEPSADYFGLTVNSYDPSDLQGLANKLLNIHGNVLVAGHSNTTPTLFSLLGCYAVSIREQDYNEIFVVDFSQNTKPKCSQFSLSLLDSNMKEAVWGKK